MAIRLEAAAPGQGTHYCPHCGRGVHLPGASAKAKATDLEPTAQEMKIAAQMGNTREQLVEQKAKEAGAPVPADVAHVLASAVYIWAHRESEGKKPAPKRFSLVWGHNGIDPSFSRVE
jgi:hypothetical protein